MGDPAADGMVRCCDCAGQRHADKGGKTRLVCVLFRDRPALVANKWRRCVKYVLRKTR